MPNFKMRQAIIFLTFLTCACNNTTTPIKTENSEQTSKQFDTFTKKFKQTDLPFTLKGCDISGTDLTQLRPDIDTPFVTSQSFAVYTFKTNGDYIATVSLGLADCLLPLLTTYDKGGKEIDQKTIAIGYCGSGPGFSCEEFMTIKSDYSIYTSDTISQTEVDSAYNVIEGGKTERHVIYKTGRLLSNGKIELTEEIKKILE